MSKGDQHQFKDRYMLRLPDGLRERLKTIAEANNRSMNAEIVARIEDSLAGDDFVRGLGVPPGYDDLAKQAELLAEYIANALIKKGIDINHGEGSQD